MPDYDAPRPDDAPGAATELSAALAVALAAARAAGEIGARHFRRRVRVERKADGTPVTEVDLAIDALLRARILGAFPQDGWLSEEGEKGRQWLDRRRAWVVDPLDGTSGYLRGEPHWCVALALLVDHRPVLGVLHAPALESTWWATAAGGAFLNGERIRASGRTELEGAEVIGPKAVSRADCWRTPWPRVRVRRYPSLALRLALVADGSADAMLAPGRKNYWDVAAGDVIVREAGGRVADLRGAPLRYEAETAKVNGIVAAGEGLFEAVLHRAKGFRCGDRAHGRHGGRGETHGNHEGG